MVLFVYDLYFITFVTENLTILNQMECYIFVYIFFKKVKIRVGVGLAFMPFLISSFG